MFPDLTMRTPTVIILAFACCGLFAQPETRPITIQETVTLSGVASLIVGPDGSFAYSTREADTADNKTKTVWHGSVCDLQPYVDKETPASAALCAPDGQALAMIAEVKGKTGIYISGRGETFLVTEFERANAFLPAAGASLAWSPDGDHLAFVGTMEPKPETPDPIVITRLQYKGRTALVDNRRTRIYVVPALAGAKPRAVTSRDFDSHSITWLASTNQIVYASNREEDPDANHNYDLFAVHPFTGKTRPLGETRGVEMTPLASSDGKWIAYTATTRDVTTIDSVAEDRHVWVMPAAGGPGRELNTALDRRCTLAGWTPDSKFVLYIASDHGKSVLWKTNVATGESEAIVDEEASLGNVRTSADGSIFYTRSDALTLPDVYRIRPGGTQAERLTRLSDSGLAGVALSKPETVEFPSFDGTPVQGWLYRPVGAAAGEKWPLVLSVHGGPHGSYGYRFSATFQLLASRGYAVLALNPRGSSGYGQKFSDGCINNWGGGDYKDLMAGVDYVVDNYPIDADRMGVMGGSYGGFMTNWIITQTTRFKAAIAVASVSNMISFYATSLYQDLVHAEFNGFPWDGDNFETLWRWSPLAHVKNVTTPTLFLHGESDNDVHITQAEEMFTALRRRGIDSTFVRYPREGHGNREPKHRVDYATRVLEWFARYL
jgi:dipeptidyl aminopeptidase/acylaminoacyl peptidase